MSDLKEDLTYRAYAAGWAVVRRLPEKTAYKLFEKAADRSWRKRGKSVRRLESNLARVLGPDADEARIREVSKQGMRNYMRYYCDTFRLETWSRQRIEDTITVHNQDKLRELLAAKRGVVMALPHMGNWDHAGAWAATVADGFTTVAERLKPEKLFERWLRYREALGMEVLPLTGGTSTFGALMRRLRSGGLVCLVAERDLTDSGVPVQFFGETTKLPAGPAALALSTGAALCPATLWYDEERLHAYVWPPLPMPTEGTKPEKIAALCQAVADTFAKGIAEHPADWHMLQRLWLVDLDPARAPGSGKDTQTAGKDTQTAEKDTQTASGAVAGGSAQPAASSPGSAGSTAGADGSSEGTR